jgi:hypothetical protein
MSKSSSVRFSAAVLALACLFALGGCGRDEGQASDGGGARPSAIVEPELRVDAVPQEEPGVARRLWRAQNDLASAVAGNLSVSLEQGRGGPVALAFANGITIRAEQLIAHHASARTGGPDGQAFQSLLALPTQVDVRVYRVLEERVTQSAPRGGLCGELRATSIAAAEFVDDRGRWVLRLAAFRGDFAPGEGQGDPKLCGVYNYEQPQ